MNIADIIPDVLVALAPEELAQALLKEVMSAIAATGL
jgi:hypothetical protein